MQFKFLATLFLSSAMLTTALPVDIHQDYYSQTSDHSSTSETSSDTDHQRRQCFNPAGPPINILGYGPPGRTDHQRRQCGQSTPPQSTVLGVSDHQSRQCGSLPTGEDSDITDHQRRETSESLSSRTSSPTSGIIPMICFPLPDEELTSTDDQRRQVVIPPSVSTRDSAQSTDTGV